ncbi:MAG: ribosome biogenesis GTPase Der [Candidatus Shikimatogenerans bostrichidophilus]|nr:MAG: ribosome biogenesis GTPase Der [Candidatus Shikimatogenerans bostrichidophilus]
MKICIIGKSNVGKSTLFNFIIKKKKSIIENNINTTRNRNYGFFKLKKKIYIIIDTGGFNEYKKKEIINNNIIKQIKLGIKEAELILFVVDVINGITNLDKKLSLIVRKYNKNTILLVNKIDIKKYDYNYYEYYKLGYNNVFPISCTNNIGFKKLYKYIHNYFIYKKNNIKKYKNNIKVSILGKPNTGKSTFINKFFNNKNKSIISNIKGTTIDTLYFFYKNKNYNNIMFIDTPGIVKNYKYCKNNNKLLLNTINIIKESDICILIIDITNGVTKNDIFIYKNIEKYKKGLIVIFNKIDLLKNNKVDIRKIKNYYKIFDNNFPYYYLSIKNLFNNKIKNNIKNKIKIIYNNKYKKIKTSYLNKKIINYINKKKIYINKKIFKIKFCYQLKNKNFPSFIINSNFKKNINDNIKKYLKKIIIKKLNLYGIYIDIYIKSNNK